VVSVFHLMQECGTLSGGVITRSRGSAVSCIFSEVSILERSSRFVMYTRGRRCTNCRILVERPNSPP
jgi:hypothetical protein